MSLTKFALSSLALAALLSACGGGGGGGVSTTAISGVAVDGYLESATAFADCNNNGTLDNNEKSAITNAEGKFTLNLTNSEAQCRIVVVATAGVTKDSGSPITQDFKLLAPAPGASTSVVASPLTTQVVAKMETGKTLDQATAELKNDLGITADVMVDFVARKGTDAEYAKAYNLAVAITKVLQTVNAQNTSLSTTLTNLGTQFNSVIKPNAGVIKAASNNPAAVLAALEQATNPTLPQTPTGFTFASLNASLTDNKVNAQTLTGSFGINTLTLSSAALDKPNLVNLVDGNNATGTVPLLSLQNVTTGELNTQTTYPLQISLTSTLGLSMSTTVDIAMSSTPQPSIVLPAQDVVIQLQFLGQSTSRTISIAQAQNLLSVSSGTATLYALRLISLLDGQTFTLSSQNFSATTLMNMVPADSYTLSFNFGNNSPLYTSTGQVKTIQLPISINN